MSMSRKLQAGLRRRQAAYEQMPKALPGFKFHKPGSQNRKKSLGTGESHAKPRR